MVDLRLIRAGCVSPALTYRCRLRFVRSYVTRSLSSALGLPVRNTSQLPLCSVCWLGQDTAIECYLVDAYYRPILSTESHRSSPHIIYAPSLCYASKLRINHLWVSPSPGVVVPSVRRDLEQALRTQVLCACAHGLVFI